LWTNERIINIFKELNKYTVNHITSFYTNYFIFIDIKNEYLDYIIFDTMYEKQIFVYDFIKNENNKIIKILSNYYNVNNIYIVAYIDITNYTKYIIEKYKTTDKILKHICNISEIIKKF